MIWPTIINLKIFKTSLMPNSKEQLRAVITELVTLGENQDSLFLWFDLYDIFDEREQAALLANLQKERDDLRALHSPVA